MLIPGRYFHGLVPELWRDLTPMEVIGLQQTPKLPVSKQRVVWWRHEYTRCGARRVTSRQLNTRITKAFRSTSPWGVRAGFITSGGWSSYDRLLAMTFHKVGPMGNALQERVRGGKHFVRYIPADICTYWSRTYFYPEQWLEAERRALSC